MNFAKLENLIDSLYEIYGVPNCDCSVYFRHQEVFRRRNGFTDLAMTKPVADNDLYFLYSATKVSLAVSVMQLIEQKKLSLDDPVSRFLPEIKDIKVKENGKLVPCNREATIEDMLSMRSGLTYDCITPGLRPDLEEYTKEHPDVSTRDYIRMLLKEPLAFQPGTRFCYGMSLDLLGAVVEIVSGEKYSDYVKNHIANPLGMKELYMHVPEDRKERMVQQYMYNVFSQNDIADLEFVPMDRFSNVTIFGPDYDSAGGGMITTVSDYVLLADALANDGIGANGAQILTRESIDEMRKNRLTTKTLWKDHAKMQNYGYGYGLGVRTMVNPRLSESPVGEFGWDGLGGAFFLSDPENRIALFFLMSVPGMIHVKAAIHNKLRDYTYEALREEILS